MEKSNSKWKWLAPLGLSLVGLGFSFTGEAIILKMQGEVWYQWVAMGTLGLVIFNSGLSVFGDAVVRRTKAEWEEKQHNDS
ncbi:MAG: hypothetical protein MRZ79_11715 [Bacteroidia bacterium]|nr:hypothetical protein [Bacteroidia bacterium]